MFNTVILLILARLYRENNSLFTWSATRQHPTSPFEKLCPRNPWKIVYYVIT